ncbi:MAG: FecR family protein [Gammaproteobacteria bacterium]|nr:FecR family protein [Gammaproteobacteria bacterium]MBU1815274.1 FecR family protein [Gammaproteobacteria bacterium]
MQQSNFPSSRLALWMAMVAAWPVQGLAAAGAVQFATGDVQLRRGTVVAAATKGSEVESGDVVVTGAGGRAQIRFSDGGLVALYPDSQFTVTRYADTGDPAQENFAVSLLRGGMRAVTGLIGKRNPQNYKVTTPTAVVGIRGSAFLVAFNDQGELVVSGEQDEIEVCTEAGCVGVKAGESVRVVSSSQLPFYTHTRAVLPLPPPPVPFAIGEQLGGGERVTPDPTLPEPSPVPVPPPSPSPSVPTPAPVPVPTPGPFDPSVPAPPPVTGTPTPTTPPTTRPPPGQTTPPTATPPPTTAPPTTPPVVRPPIFVLPPIVRPIFVLPPIAVPPPPPPIIR